MKISRFVPTGLRGRKTSRAWYR